MIFDKTTLLSDAQAITATAASTNTIDLGATGTVYGAAAALTRDDGKGMNLKLHIQVVEDFATLTSLTVAVQCDTADTFGSPKTLTQQTIAVADLKAGRTFSIMCVPPGVDERYLRLNYTVAGTNATTGKVTAGLTMGSQTNGVDF
jgi:hypothetical protein